MTRVGLAIIARDEQENLPHLLRSVEGAFDRVVLLDTGSTDDTVKLFRGWARKHPGRDFSWDVAAYEWCDDFGDARRAADRLLMWGPQADIAQGNPLVEWTCWADCDDEIMGAANIKPLCAQATPDVAAFLIDYDYSQHPDTGASLQYLKRERMVRAGHGEWVGRVHEAQVIKGGAIVPVAPNLLLWKHRKGTINIEDARASNPRNLRILQRWHEAEPDNPRVLSYLGIEHAIQGKHDEAVNYYKLYLSLTPGWDEERAQVCRRLAVSLFALDRVGEVFPWAFEALHTLPDWPDNFITLAEANMLIGQPVKAEKWARMAIEAGPPGQTLLIVNPLDYTWLPWRVLADALAAQGRHEEAVAAADRGLAAFPDGALAQAREAWRAVVKRERTAQTFVMAAQQLIAHDEQLKARGLLDAVPHFAWDHPQVVAMREHLAERLAWLDTAAAFAEHYTDGGSKPEDFIPDDQVDPICDALTRTHFALHGILEQAGVSA